MNSVRLVGALLCMFLLGRGVTSRADETPAPAATDPAIPAFHRTFIPAEEIQNRAWAHGYLPMDAKQFAQLLQTIRWAAAGAPSARAIHIERAQYTAQLVGDDLLVGRGTLELTHSAASDGILVLDPCNLALGAAWQDRRTRPAVLGTGPDGRLRALVEGPRLSFDWSLRGERTASGAVSFRLELPNCPMAALTLDAPAGLEVTADPGIVSQGAPAEPQSGRWTVELGGHRQLHLRVVAENLARQRRPLTLLRQAVTYRFSTRGVNLVAQLTLDVHGEPLERIALDLDPNLRLVAARYGELEIPWSATADVETRLTHAVLQLPEPIVGTGRVLQLSAMAPLESGKQWRLPGLRPQAMSWQEGTAELSIPSLFVLERLVTDGCRQSKVTALPAPLAGEAIEIQYYRPGATIDVVVAQPRERLKVDSGTLVEVGSHEVTSLCGVQLGLARGQRRAARIDIQSGWTVDAVEDLETRRPVNWELDDSPSDSAFFKVSLDSAIAPDRPARLLVHGRRALPAASVFDARQLQMLALDQFQRGIRLISIHAAEGSELRWTGSQDLDRIDPLKLSPAELRLFPQPAAGFVFAEDAAFAQAAVALQRRKPNYAADIRIDAAVQKNVLTETYTIQCVPEAARVDRLLVHFSHARDASLEWSLAGGNSGQFSARRLSAGEQTQTALPPGGEVWELNLQLARPGAFEVRGVRSLAFDADTPLSLASITDAATQRGTVAIRALADSGLAIKSRLAPVPAERLDADRYQTARATYHYQPSRDDLGPEPAVTIAPTKATQAESGAWAWHNRLDSRYAPDGSSVHWATYHIQTAGRQQLRLSLGADAKLQAAWVDGQPLSPGPTSPAEDAVVIDLPPGRRFATLSLCYSTPDGLSALVTSHEPPFPTLDIPIMARQWSVWLPPGYSIPEAAGRFSADSPAPLTWSQRFFGVLGRGPGQKVFNPLAASDWRTTFAGAANQATRQAADGFAENLGTIVAKYAAGEELTWGQLLSLCAEAEAESRRTLLIDDDSLTWLGLTPQARVRLQSDETGPERGFALLKDARLVLMADAATIVITSAPGAASYASHLSQHENPIVHALSPGPLLDEVRRAAAGQDWSRFASVESWRGKPERAPSPWVSPSIVGPNFNEIEGWSAYTLRLSETSNPRIRIVRTAAMDSLAWAVFLAVVSLGLWNITGRPAALVLLASISALAALVLPAAYLPPVSATLWAALFCLAVRITQVPQPRPRPNDPSRGSRKLPSSVAHELARFAFLAAVVNIALAVNAAQPPQAARSPAVPPKESSPGASAPQVPPSQAAGGSQRPDNEHSKPAPTNGEEQRLPSAPIHRVLVPTDEQQNPVGGKYYVPEELYRQLHRLAASASGQQNDWLITRGVYQGTLARDAVNHRLGLTHLTAHFDLHVFQSNAQVQLPLAREGMAKTIVGARLEGRPIPIAWNAAGDALVVGTMLADRYRLELDLQPPLQADASGAGFDMAIPPLPNATLELTFPADGPTIELPTARGQIRVQKERGELSAQLGSSDRLAVRWPVGVGLGAAPNLEVEELIWVKVRPGTTMLDAKFKYRVLGGRVQQIRLLTDPRLRLLPSTSPESPVAAVHTIPGDPQRIDLELARPVSDQVVVDLSFLVTNTSGVGNLRLPRLESSSARASKRWLAVTVDAALQPKIQAGEDSKTIDIPDFATAWGAADSRPQAAYSIPRGEPVWVLATQPNEPRTTVEQILAVSLGRSASPVQFDAQLSIAGGHLLQLGLQGPSGLVVEKVSMLEDELQRVTRWSVDDHGRITVFLNAPVDGRQRLSLRGRWDAVHSDAFQAPRFELLGAETKKSQLQLYRQPAVLADIKRSPSASEVQADENEDLDDFGALLGRYLLEDPQANVTITLAPNVPKSRAVAMTYLQRDADRWMADFHYHLEVLEGIVDSLQFEIPPQWSEPYRIEPAAPFRVVSIPGEQRRQLIVYPDKPVAGKYQLKIRGRVALSAGDRLRVGDILPLRAQQIERFVVLPESLDLQRVTWDTFGLSRAPLPAEFDAAMPKAASHVVYQVAGERFQASLKAVERAGATAQVALADLHVIWQGDGNCEGVAIFDLEPGGATSCVLELPVECRLLHASIENSPALLVALDANRWRLTFESQQLPQRIEVVYSGPLAGAGNRRQFSAPRLKDLEVGRTMWTIHGPPGFGIGEALQSALSASPAQQELHRLKIFSALVQLPAEVVGEHLPEEILRWYRPWKKRFLASRAAFDWTVATGRHNDGRFEADAAARDLDKQIVAVDARLGTASPSASQVSLAAPSTELLADARTSSLPAHFMSAGQLYDLEVRFPQSASDAFWLRLLFGCAILLAGSAAAMLLRGRLLPKFEPVLVIGGMGLAWWLLLAPSFIGLAVFLVTGAVALRARWQASGLPAR